jgi:hypothetical protein
MEEAMPHERIDVPWDDATDAERSADMELWWVKACPKAGSDEYLILQMMSTTDMRHGDPQSAQRTLIERGLLELTSEHRSNFTEKGREVFLSLLDKVARVHDMSTADPTPEGIKRHPPDGFFRTDAFEHPVSEPCTCTADCPEWCEGGCGCDACTTRLEVYAAPGSAHGEQ